MHDRHQQHIMCCNLRHAGLEGFGPQPAVSFLIKHWA
jgi:hypothetical protein